MVLYTALSMMPKRRIVASEVPTAPSKFVAYTLPAAIMGDPMLWVQFGYLVGSPLVVLYETLMFGMFGMLLSTAVLFGFGAAYYNKCKSGTFLPENWNYEKDNVQGRVILVTGSNGGMGRDIVMNLVEWKAAKVLMACRGLKEAEIAKKEAEELASQLQSPTEISIIHVDLGDLETISPAVEAVKKVTDKLDVVVACAGVMMCPLSKTKQGFEMQWGTNHLGHHALIRGLLDMLRSSGTASMPSRVISFSSVGHQFGCTTPYKGKCMQADVLEDYITNFDDSSYDKTHAYGISKMSNILMTKYFQDEEDARVGKENRAVCFYSVHPGGVVSKLARHLQAKWEQYAMVLLEAMERQPRGGIQSCMFAMSAPLDFLNPGGYYFDCQELAPLQECLYPSMRRLLMGISDGILKKFAIKA